MPELPEVETTRRGVAPHVDGREIKAMLVREPRLRWPIPDDLPAMIEGQRITAVHRRAKYLLFHTAPGYVLLHLGMSGSLRLVDPAEPAAFHDHFDIVLSGDKILRYNDPRRFGCCLWQPAGEAHPLLVGLGPEPLSADFDGDLLYRRSRGRRGPVKSFLMDQKIVVGVGNIYANEALFLAGIRPDRAAGRISRARYQVLAERVKQVLTSAIEQGGTTLRDFVGGDGKPGYFAQQLFAYGREGLPCKQCGKKMQESRISQRTTVYCVACQR
ncbi:bifunctional DNA-formamidopyrimidine glycosylase/DNA-(apurinic or apyrimidinic site) lyase [Seongchinamella unica]|uniref:Formamidopyrimidine-DNA glycosylase n=1 Tax=Seongchinamella unica TaxID=2547392 RepID=A0A4R5LW47_9GAMM|nr:bifunctional DNA-formamidopyrimidine glycosylase/DNA-(apurinic or apyrimidinic site) lyase [Seongchinamella unica]TDG15694.1 bifunctional DNA-formamidopyrimidine glycosylase/DNA-(apurinic or apyrimidinic site) lyase [Seongchinamella unica]